MIRRLFTVGTLSLTVRSSPDCSFDLTGTVDSGLDETSYALGGVAYQDLTISGSTLQAQNVTSSCLGAITTGATTVTTTFGIESPTA